MRKRFAAIAIAALASLTLLIPAGSASAASGSYDFCYSNNLTRTPATLKPGQDCRGFGPLNLFRVYGVFEIVKPGNGAVCVGIIRNGTTTPLNDYNQPSGWNQTGEECQTITGAPAGTWANADRRVVGGFGAVPGQPIMLNYSTATIKSTLYTTAGYYY
jgi:hypothetical protein